MIGKSSNINDLARVLTTKGYAIKKISLTQQEATQLRKDLTVSPIVANAAAATLRTQTFPVYLESSSRFYIPRMYGRKNYGPEEANVVPAGLPLPQTITFKGKPYDYQEKIIDSFIDQGANGLICVPCGKGKTFMALAAAVRIGKRFLVVVDKEFLLLQWKKEIEAFIEGARIGVIQGPLCQIDPAKYDIVLCMIQTVCSRDFPENTFSGFGLTIFDECHHLGAAYFSRTLMKIQTAAQLGLSATPVRDDGLTKVFEWYLGPPVYWEKTREPDATVTVRQIKFSTTEPEYNREQTDYKGDLVMARMLTQICESPERNLLIATLLKDLLKKRPNHRKILVLSERIEHLRKIEAVLVRLCLEEGIIEVNIGYYIGGMKESVREKGAKESNILLASYSMASEAMNIKELNTVILASPRKKVEQSTGRILRQRKEERVVEPLIIDVVDSHGIYVSQWRKRFQYYKQCGYKIERIHTNTKDCDEDNDTKDDQETIPGNIENTLKGCLIMDD
jgi:superfamily II DNA or RNA helicase